MLNKIYKIFRKIFVKIRVPQKRENTSDGSKRFLSDPLNIRLGSSSTYIKTIRFISCFSERIFILYIKTIWNSLI